ncbi:hypothetical protein BH24ACT20_BH24ACT20_01680 [soil metagenome]
MRRVGLLVFLAGLMLVAGAGGVLAATGVVKFGGPGDDRISGTAGDDRIYGKGGDDDLSGSPSARICDPGTEAAGDVGYPGAPVRSGNDVIFGGVGRDIVSGGGGSDRVLGGRGGDRVIGGSGPDFLIGGPGRDRLFGGSGADAISGGAGNDLIFNDYSGGKPDRIACGKGFDRVYAKQTDVVAGNCEAVKRFKRPR